jgi:putative hydrolase of the HAD superfamily
MAIRGIIFDFDGLILDTETPDLTVLSEQYQDHGVTLQVERWALGLGTHGAFHPYEELRALLGRPVDEPALQQARRARYLQIVENQSLQPGVTAVLALAEARGLGRAIASSSDRVWVAGWAQRHGIHDRFQAIRTRDDVARVKPAPDLFLAAATALGLPPAECLVLEDSPNGMRAALAAGMACVAVPIPALAQAELPPHTLRLASLAQLPADALLAEVERRLASR